MATAFPEKQLLLILWQIKNDTLAGFLILCVQAITLLELYYSGSNVVSNGLHSQKQCIIIPSAMGQQRRQVYCFFICLLG
ncbi:hypothetical protein [Flavobacterium limnophilum]|uniref:hypothetical protein n=1 Tax=Flavobacterium limnophilum TaxID=3003262 RepID=UPI0022ABD9FA|nr:hypothetical protein [Flavobacterium limnophilum]